MYPVGEPLRTDAIRRHLNARWMGQSLQCHDEVDSTNDIARDLGRAGAAEGTVVVAEAQRRGRGRLGRAWVSPPGKNLSLSVVLRPRLEAERPSPISLLAGVAVCDAVTRWHPATIKWPNDILIGTRKVAGILAEIDGRSGSSFIVLGIGVNLNAELNDFPVELQHKAGSLRMATGTARTPGRERRTQ